MGITQSLTGLLMTTRDHSWELSFNPWKRKRRRISSSEDSDEEHDSTVSRALHTRKRKRLMTTSQYIYRALFQEGQNSDITLIALGKEWKLHKVYLCQSAYFASMFSGAWKESNQDVITIEIVDPRITLEALGVVLGSLYQDELTVEPAEVVPLLATATLLQLDGVIDQCVAIMEETVNPQTAIRYYEAATQYGVLKVKDTCFKWLLVNLLSYLPSNPKRLREVSVDLMSALVASHNLCVIETEFSLYVLLKLWVFFKLNPNWDGSAQEGVTAAHEMFQSRPDTDPEFLCSEEGCVFEKAFRGLRLTSLLGHPQDVDMIQNDRIIPAEWLLPLFRLQWYRMLRSDQGHDKGPKQISEVDFNQNSLRFGRILSSDGYHSWRWTGFLFGLDLVMTFERGGTFKLKRNHCTENDISLSQQSRRNLMYRVTVFSLDAQRQVKSSQTTGVHSVSLGKNEEIRLMQLDKDMEFPLLLSVNFLVASVLGSSANTAIGLPKLVSGLNFDTADNSFQLTL